MRRVPFGIPRSGSQVAARGFAPHPFRAYKSAASITGTTLPILTPQWHLP